MKGLNILPEFGGTDSPVRRFKQPLQPQFTESEINDLLETTDAGADQNVQATTSGATDLLQVTNSTARNTPCCSKSDTGMAHTFQPLPPLIYHIIILAEFHFVN